MSLIVSYTLTDVISSSELGLSLDHEMLTLCRSHLKSLKVVLVR